MGVKSPAPIGPREAGHHSRDVSLCLKASTDYSITQAECVLTKKTGEERAGLIALPEKSRNASRLNYPSLETGGAREDREEKGEDECGSMRGATTATATRPTTSVGTDVTSPLCEMTWQDQAHRGE